MTPLNVQSGDTAVDSELEHLTYSAYLLTLDPALALSVVMTALDRSLADISAEPDLETLTVELSLKHLNCSTCGDHESSGYEAELYRDPRLLSAWSKDVSSNPIVLLNDGERVAFVLHHILGYEIKESGGLAGMSEHEFRAQLRRAYVQLASTELRAGVEMTAIPDDSAKA